MSVHPLIAAVRNIAAPIASLRRDLHAHPELRFQEQRTSDLIATTLENWSIPVHRGVGHTGVVGVIRGGSGRRAIGLRADIDALPITEASTFEHASTCPGKMHACGHDGHVAMLLAAAKHLAERGAFDGTVYVLFQPAEEGAGGARAMIEDGLFQRFPMDAMFGVHNWPDLSVGQFAIKSGPVMASGTRFKVTIFGRGSHAAMPHQGIDPLQAGVQIVQALQTIITRNKKPIEPAVLSVTKMHAGEVVNASPDRCEIGGTIRAFSPDVVDMVESRMRAIVDGICGAFGATNELEFDRYCPPTVNHENETVLAREALVDLVGSQNVCELQPTMGSEDFGEYLLRTPGCFFWIGSASSTPNDQDKLEKAMLHSPSYDFNDEIIPIGGAMWVQIVERWFASASS